MEDINIVSSDISQPKPVKLRNSNLELYRIITMLLIVAHHYVVNSGLLGTFSPIWADTMSPRALFLFIFGAFGKTGINCFMLITGYFMCRSEITLKKFFKLLLEVELYNILIWLIFVITGYESFSFDGMLSAFIPFRSISDGFTSSYLFFFLFIPFLNILVRGMNEKQHLKLLILCSFMYIIVGSVPGFGIVMNYVSWFAVLYLISSYIRIYDKKIFNNTALWGWCSLAMLIISIASIIVMTWLGRSSYFFLSDSNKILAVLLAVCSFLFFKNLKMKNNRLINTVAASTFGVLLIHANSASMRSWLWQDVLHNVDMYYSNWLIPHAIGSVICIFAVCTVIDHLRIRFIEAPLFKHSNDLFDKVSNSYKRLESKICKKFNIGENDK